MKSIFGNKLKSFIGKAGSTGTDSGPFKAEIISVASLKGGVGKTTTAIHVASAFSFFQGKKTLLVDLDPQSQIAVSLGIDNRNMPGIADVFLEQKDIFDVRQRVDALGLDIIVAGEQIQLAETKLNSKVGKELFLKKLLKKIATYYEVIIFDCPPSKGVLTLNSLMASGWLLLPCELSKLSIDGASSMIQMCIELEENLDHNIELLGIAVTKFDKRNSSMNKAIEAEIGDEMKGFFLENRVPINTSLMKAQASGKAVYQTEPSSTSSVSYQKLAREIGNRLWNFQEH